MNQEAFKKYVATRKQMDKELSSSTIDEFEEQYRKLKEHQSKANEYAKKYHADRMNTDDEYKQKRQEYLKKSNKKAMEKKQKNKKSTNNDKPLNDEINQLHSRMDEKGNIQPMEKPMEKQKDESNDISKAVETEKLPPQTANNVHFLTTRFYGLGF